MSGHSKWHSIKHKKAVVDARRGQHFTKLARAITVAAREGGGDADGNPALALAVQKARDASMPKDNIERAIAKGTGEGVDADQIETVLYEGYGPGGVALLIEALTDNRNRTGADVRHAAHQARRQPRRARLGLVPVRQAGSDRRRRDPLRRGRPDAGDRRRRARHRRDEDVFEVITEPADLVTVRAGAARPASRSRARTSTQRPKARVPVEEADAARLLRLIDALEESDDVARSTPTSTSTPRCSSGSPPERRLASLSRAR